LQSNEIIASAFGGLPFYFERWPMKFISNLHLKNVNIGRATAVIKAVKAH
jgi:hypothetical protein